MKNYYRILGIKKDASEEEIREHWVELMRKLHPDQRIEGKAEDERIKEINEAYQVLKHSSTRVEYDLKRAYDQRKRNSYLRRLSIPIAIFVVLVMIGTLYLRKSQITLQANLPTQNRVNQIDQTNQINQTNQKDQTNQIDQRNQINQTDQKDQINQINPIVPSTQQVLRPKDAIVRPTQRNKDPGAASNQRNQRNQRKQIDQPDKITQPDQTNLSRLPRSESVRGEMRSLFHWDQINQRNQTDQINPIAPTPQKNIPSVLNDTNDLNDPNVPHMAASTPLIATEEEVRGFFGNYTERYTQRDLDSFISLFSSRAIQNRQDGLEGIRQIYGNFLKQSQEIKYDIDHIKIEIYQNGIEVKARYELVQMVKKSGDKRIWRGDIRWSLIKEDGALKILSLDYQHQKSP